ncbi:MAG: TIR domain-containing protein [bacterium]|nr:TIR domain-containing protein [bacterium]
MSYDSSERALVRELADALTAYGLSPWFDERDLISGRPWVDTLEEVIQETHCIAIIVGREGIRRWHKVETRAALEEFVRRDISVIPVLVPGAPDPIELPPFLRPFTCVDLREGLSKENTKRLVAAIHGQKPPTPPKPKRRLWKQLVGPGLPLALLAGLGLWWSNPAHETHTPQKDRVYQVRIIALSPDGQPLDGTEIETSVSAETQRVSSGWEVEIPPVKLPQDRTITVWITKKSAYLKGAATITLGSDFRPRLDVRLKKTASTLAGLVVDEENRPLTRAHVFVIGQLSESTWTLSDGQFALDVSTSEGEITHLRAEKQGYQPAEEYPYAGDLSVRIMLRKAP